MIGGIDGLGVAGERHHAGRALLVALDLDHGGLEQDLGPSGLDLLLADLPHHAGAEPGVLELLDQAGDRRVGIARGG